MPYPPGPPRLGRPARMLGVVGSTMAEAAAWADEGAPHGALVVAEHQTAGRGRHGRRWTDAPGSSLMLSLVLRPTELSLALPAERLGLVSLAAGLAVCEAVEAVAPELSPRLKWPNDVLLGAAKLAGVLPEVTWAAGVPTVVLGVGINVEQQHFPPSLGERATSLHLATGRAIDRLALLGPFLDALEAHLDRAATAPATLLDALEARMGRLGGAVRVAFPGVAREPLMGTTLGLAADGALRVRTEAGEALVHAGEVTLADDWE